MVRWVDGWASVRYNLNNMKYGIIMGSDGKTKQERKIRSCDLDLLRYDA